MNPHFSIVDHLHNIEQCVYHTGNNPAWSVTDGNIQSLARSNDIVEGAHDLSDRGSVLPDMDVQDIDISCTQAFQTAIEGLNQVLALVTAFVQMWGYRSIQCLALLSH